MTTLNKTEMIETHITKQDGLMSFLDTHYDGNRASAIMACLMAIILLGKKDGKSAEQIIGWTLTTMSKFPFWKKSYEDILKVYQEHQAKKES